MKFLAGYVMRGPAQAVLLASVCSVLSLILPPLSYLGGAAVGLVTLRLGPARGAMVAAGAATAVAVLSLILVQTALPGPTFLVALWLPVWLLTLVLRRYVSLPLAALAAGAFGALFVGAVHGLVDDPGVFWRGMFDDMLRQAGQETAAEGMQEAYAVMTGALAAGFTLSLVGSLFVARWWQAQLYNPGGFQTEFHALRFGRGLVGLTLAVSAVAFYGQGGVAAFAVDLLIVLVVLHLLHGLAVAHDMVKRKGVSMGWLVALYVLMVAALPPTAITVSAVGVADAWFDFRSFFDDKREEGN